MFVNHLNDKSESNYNKKYINTQDVNKNNNYYNCIYENPNEEKSCNFEDFFDKINQNKKVLEILSQETENIKISNNDQLNNNNYIFPQQQK